MSTEREMTSMETINRSDRPVILVTGATEAQGGSVVKHLLRRGRYAVRALTRSPRSEAAEALRQQGAEVVDGDLADLGSLRAAVSGCYGVYGVKNFWEHFEGEYQHGINLVDAVADAGVGHFVFSTLPSVERLTDGALRVPHFDLAARMEEYARSLGLPATFVHLAYYFDNFMAWFAPQPQEDGTYAFGFPQGDTRLAGIAAEDVGGVVAPVFERRDEFVGKTLYLVGDDLPPTEYADVMSRVSGKTVRYQHVPREVFAAYGFPGAADLADMFDFYRTRVPERTADLLHTRELYPEVQDFATWLAKNRERFAGALSRAS
jgi:uncharacterized protein YbjT (DUF2867 family)